MPLIAVGVNHRTAAVDVRERLSIAPSRMPETLDELRALDGIAGAAVLSTCNRVEAIVSAAGEDVIEPIVNWLTDRAGANRAELEKHVYILRHGDVLKHLFRVASGLDSMIVGEPQIAKDFPGQLHGRIGHRHGVLANAGVGPDLLGHAHRLIEHLREE